MAFFLEEINMRSKELSKEQMETPRWIEEKRVAELTGIAVQTLRNWRFKRTGPPYFKVRRSVRYRLDEVIRYMEERRVNVEN